MQGYDLAGFSVRKEEWYRIAHELVAVGLAKGEEPVHFGLTDSSTFPTANPYSP